MATFNSPYEAINKQDTFGVREVGLTHPDNESSVRIKDNGDIELVAGEVVVSLSAASSSVTIIADHIKLLTKKDNGLRWNELTFNDRATTFNEPTFITVDDNREGFAVYSGVEYFSALSDEELAALKSRGIQVTDSAGQTVSFEELVKRYRKEEETVDESELWDV